MSKWLSLTKSRRCCSFLFTFSPTALNRHSSTATPHARHERKMAAASSSGGPNRFGLDKTKGLNDLCRRDARIRAEKEAAAVELFSRRFDECSIEDQSSLSAQRHFALQVQAIHAHSFAYSDVYQEAKFGGGKHMLCRRCWLMNKDCICQKAKHIPSSQFQHRLIIYMLVFYCMRLFCTLRGLPRYLTQWQALQGVFAVEQHRRTAPSQPGRQPHQRVCEVNS